MVTTPTATTSAKPVPVTADNFNRAESHMYFSGTLKRAGGLGRFNHRRQLPPLDQQGVIRANRDTLYSEALFDLDAGPVTVTLPDPADRFMSMIVLDEEQYALETVYGPGTFTYTKEKVGTRYVLLGIRTFVNPKDKSDLEKLHDLQDAITVKQKATGTVEFPNWDPVSQKKVREALMAVSNTLPDLRYAAGPNRTAVDPVRRIAAAASGWGLNPDRDAIYLNVFPDKNEGTTAYRLTVNDVPVDAFWSVTVYTAEGFFKPNELNAYSINSVTGKKGAEGAITIQFGGCSKNTPNCLPVTPGWNYMVRLYRPRQDILNGTWSFPVAEPVQ